MGWLKDFLLRVYKQPPTNWTFVEHLEDSTGAIAGAQFLPDDCYVEVWVESAKLEAYRKLATTFSPAIYTSISIASEGTERVYTAGMRSSSAELQSDTNDRVIKISSRVHKPVPWRGGTLELELAVFSVKQNDLLTPILQYVTNIASKAGISAASVVDPFVPLITEGLEIIAGQTEDSVVEIGLDVDMSLTSSGFFAVIAAPKEEVNFQALAVDKNDRALLFGPLAFRPAYCVFSIRRVETNSEWASVPALREGWARVAAATMTRDTAQVKEALETFRAIIAFSPHLIQRDKETLYKKAAEYVGFGMLQVPGGGGSSLVPPGTQGWIPSSPLDYNSEDSIGLSEFEINSDLSSLNLYG